ncbi:TerD family protein [Nocardia sp. NPDC058666]|uniref:TerD family protein n=1 Tax=Nocardia sp. NPDC058666 TaxID=3346587 RepID=UPI0036526A47
MPGAVPHTALTHITVGLGWDPVRASMFRRRPKDIDLNVAALSFSGTRFVDVAFHEQLTSRDGAIRLLGDSLDGVGDGDDEIMVLDLTRLAPDITTVVLLITCYTGQRFEQIENAFTRVIDSVTGTELARIDLAVARAHTGFVFGKLLRAQQDWQFTAIAQPIAAEHVADAVPHLTPYLN